MEKYKKILKKLFFLPPLPTVFIAVPSFFIVFYVLAMGAHPVLAYLSYLLSAYALVITATGICNIIEAAKNGVEQNSLLKKIESNPLGRKIMGDGGVHDPPCQQKNTGITSYTNKSLAILKYSFSILR